MEIEENHPSSLNGAVSGSGWHVLVVNYRKVQAGAELEIPLLLLRFCSAGGCKGGCWRRKDIISLNQLGTL